MKRWFFPIVAYLTLIHNALIVTVVLNAHLNANGSTVAWGLEFSRATSPNALTLLGAAVWTTLLSVGCLLRTRRRPETHCRKCDYILRGLSEPRCSECGEPI